MLRVHPDMLVWLVSSSLPGLRVQVLELLLDGVPAPDCDARRLHHLDLGEVAATTKAEEAAVAAADPLEG